jgi:uncharacterized UBP type Zn finger protein
MSDACSHLDTIDAAGGPTPAAEGCVECLAMGARWVHLRRCLECGHVGCCDSSPNKHATAHFHEISHPLVQSFEPGEEWIYCYSDDVMFELQGLPVPSPAHP